MIHISSTFHFLRTYNSVIYLCLKLFCLDVWILGDSIPYWAGVRAKEYGKPNLGIPGRTIEWLAVRGLRWTSLRHEIEAKVLLSSPPSLIY